MPMKPREMIKLLKKHGFQEKSQNGTSHLKMFNPETGVTLTVPRHSKELGKSLEKEILKEAGLPH